MLTSVPVSITRAARQVTLRHPNGFSCIVSRKKVTRVALDGNNQPSEMGGVPTMGGLGVLRSEDEASIEYVELGPAKMVTAMPARPADLVERDNATVPETMSEWAIECLAEPGTAGYFVPDSGDLVAVDMGLGVVTAFEVASPSSNVMMAPYTRRYFLTPRDDLDYVPGFDN